MIVLVLAAGCAFAGLLIMWVVGPSILGVFSIPGFVITMAIFAVLRAHPSEYPQLLWMMSVAFNTLIYGAVLGLLLWILRLFRHKPELLVANEKDD